MCGGDFFAVTGKVDAQRRLNHTFPARRAGEHRGEVRTALAGGELGFANALGAGFGQYGIGVRWPFGVQEHGGVLASQFGLAIFKSLSGKSSDAICKRFLQHGDADHIFGCARQDLKILAEPAEATEPSERALDNPTFRKDGPSVFDLG